MPLGQALFGRGLATLSGATGLTGAIGLERFSHAVASDALDALAQEELSLFDANIGDQWCEARASLILGMLGDATRPLQRESSELREKIRLQAEGLDRLLGLWREAQHSGERARHLFSKRLKQWPGAVLNEAGFGHVDLDPRLKFLILSYFLKRFYSLYRNPAKLRAIADAHQQSANGVEAIIKSARRFVNAAADSHVELTSRRLVERVSANSAMTPAERLRYLGFCGLCRRPSFHGGLLKRPVYPGMKVLLADLWTSGVPILLVAKLIVSSGRAVTLRRLYAPDSEMAFRYRPVRSLGGQVQASGGQRVFVVEGVSDPLHVLPPGIGAVHLTEILDGMATSTEGQKALVTAVHRRWAKLGIDKMLALNTACHPQFLDPHQQLDQNPAAVSLTAIQDYRRLRGEAAVSGCSIDNMATLRIYHMFADTLSAAASRSASTVWSWGK